MQFLKETNINFVSPQRLRLTRYLSLAAIAVGLFSLAVHGGPRLSIDFSGGTLVQVRFDQPVPAADLREALGSAGLAGSTIQQFGAPDEMLIRVLEMREGTDTAEAIAAAISANLQTRYEIRRVEKVGPKIGSELRGAAVLAIIAALSLIAVYITIRFRQVAFALGAIVALAHDVLIALGVFSLLNLEISLAILAAFLTIVGYSLNDTIVVYDRVRENTKIMRREPYDKMINASINLSLSRTIITSLTTLFVVTILYLFGSEPIRDFAFAMIIGVLVGTYSSVFIACPILITLRQRSERKASLP